MTESAAAAASTWSPANRVESADILFVGDTGFGVADRTADGAGLDDLYEAPVLGLQPLLSDADLVVANLEAVLTERRDSPFDGELPYLATSEPSAGAHSLLDHNIGAVTLANNHIMDMGEDGFLDTLSTLEEHGILYGGAGRDRDRARTPMRIVVPFTDGTERGVSLIAGLRTSTEHNDLTGTYATAKSPGCASLRSQTLSAQIRAVRAAHPNELIIVSPHWRRAYRWASDAQRRFAESMVQAGADLVIGHGSHMAQEIDIADGRLQLHGIGDFVLDSHGRSSRKDAPPFSLMVRLRLTSSETRIRLYPIHTGDQSTGFRSHHVSDEQFEEFHRTGLARTSRSSALLKAVSPGADGYGPYLDVPLNDDRRTTANRHRTGHGTTLTTWESRPEPLQFDRSLGSSIVIQRELDRRGATYERLERSLIIGESAEGLPFLLKNTVTNRTGAPGTHATVRKDIARRLMARVGISIAEGHYFTRRKDFSSALGMMNRMGSVVVKPVDGNIGRGVTVGVTTEEELREAWSYAFGETQAGILVEQRFVGDDVRISVVDGVAHAANNRIPPHVVGDGAHTIRDLINEKNEARYQNLHLHPKPIELTDYRLKRLSRHGLTVLSVLEEGRTYVIDPKGNLATGAEPADVTATIHPSYLREAERTARAFPDVDIAGVDLLGSDFSERASPDNHIVVEANRNPDISSHGTAFTGTPRDVVGPAMDSLLKARESNTYAPRVQAPAVPERPTSASLLAAEFSARGLTIDWIDDTFFTAQSDRFVHSIWRSTTNRTGQAALLALRRQDWSTALLTRGSIPMTASRVFDPSNLQAARKFASTLRGVTMHSARRFIDVDDMGRDAFDTAWREITHSGSAGGIRVSARSLGQRLRLLVAHGRVLTALDDSSESAESRDILDQLHSTHRAIAAAAAGAFPGLDLAEVTLTVGRPKEPAVEGTSVVEDVKGRPDLAEHASRARAGDIIGTIVDLHMGHDHPAAEGPVIEVEARPIPGTALRAMAQRARRQLRRAAARLVQPRAE